MPNATDHTQTIIRCTPAVILLAIIVAAASLAPFLLATRCGPTTHVSVLGEEVTLHGCGPYRHMPADIAIQGLAQDLVTLAIAVPLLLVALLRARRQSLVARLVLTGTVAYLMIQYILYMAMATYNELFLLWVAAVLISSQVLIRLMLLPLPLASTSPLARRYVGGFLILAGTVIASLWLSVLVPPLLDGSLYPAAMGGLTTMVVQGFDLALFIPPALFAGYWYLRADRRGTLAAPVYAVFLSVQMLALLAKVIWMTVAGTGAGPALVMIPLLLAGALFAAALALRPYHRGSTPFPAQS
jgi:hypothetical protein